MEHYDVIIIGAGVSGTALAYVLTQYTNIKRIALIEKHKEVAQVASHYTQNSQTLHYGDIETNYTFEKAKSTAAGARLVEHYLERFAKNAKIHRKEHKMVIGVGNGEVRELKKRYNEFKTLFPELKLLSRKEIEHYEPNVLFGRDPKENIVAFYSPNGYVVDYERLAKHFLAKAQKSAKLDIFLDEEVTHLSYSTLFTVKTQKRVLTSNTLVVNAGAMSLYLAKMLGYGKHLSVFSVAGNFYRIDKPLVTGKVYTAQLAKLPFAAPHADPDVHDTSYTRFGPSAKPLLMLERWNYGTVNNYFQSFVWSWDGFVTVIKIAFDPVYLTYMLKNMLYDIPFIGSRLFARSVVKIIPSLRLGDVYKDKGYGGARPQIINTKTREISMGEARIEEENCIFNITPSPGASTSLANAKRDALMIIHFLGKYRFNDKKFEKNLE